jgi:hypothetical protein
MGNILFTCRSDANGNPLQPISNAGASVLPNTATGLNPVITGDASLLWVLAISAGDRVELLLAQ